MQFKITIVTSAFFLLISSLSIAKPIVQKEKPPLKAEQTYKQKPNFIQKIIFKKTIKRIEYQTERVSILATISLWLGIASFPLVIGLGIVGRLTALAAIITGGIALRKKEVGRKSRAFSIAGIVLGVFFTLAALLLLIIFISTGNIIKL